MGLGIWVLTAILTKIAMIRFIPGYGDALKDWVTFVDPMALGFWRRFWRVELIWIGAMAFVGLMAVMFLEA